MEDFVYKTNIVIDANNLNSKDRMMLWNFGYHETIAAIVEYIYVNDIISFTKRYYNYNNKTWQTIVLTGKVTSIEKEIKAYNNNKEAAAYSGPCNTVTKVIRVKLDNNSFENLRNIVAASDKVEELDLAL